MTSQSFITILALLEDAKCWHEGEDIDRIDKALEELYALPTNH